MLGSSGAGLVWGWYSGLALALAPRRSWAWPAFGAATALLVAGTLTTVGRAGARLFLAGALVGAFVSTLWRASLRRRSSPGASKDLPS